MDMLADQEILSEVSQDPYIRSHPCRVSALPASHAGPSFAYRDVEDSAEMRHRHKMAQAKIRGFLDHRRPRCAAIQAKIPICPRAMPAPLPCTDRASLIRLCAKLMPDCPVAQLALVSRTQRTGELRSRRAANGLAAYKKSVELAPDQPLLFGSGDNPAEHCRNGGECRKIQPCGRKNLRKALRLDRPIQQHIFSFPKHSARCNVWPMLNGRWPSISPFWVGRKR